MLNKNSPPNAPTQHQHRDSRPTIPLLADTDFTWQESSSDMSDLQEDRDKIDITLSSPIDILDLILFVIKQGFNDMSDRINAVQRAQASTRQTLSFLIGEVEDLKRRIRYLK